MTCTMFWYILKKCILTAAMIFLSCLFPFSSLSSMRNPFLSSASMLSIFLLFQSDLYFSWLL